MKVIMASAEVAPFARVGGLSDVVGSLPKEIAEAGHDVSVFLPKYASIDDGSFSVEPVHGAGDLAVPRSGKDPVALYRCPMPGTPAVTVYMVRYDPFFDRDGIYVDPKTRNGYPDEVERYALFGRALLEAARVLRLEPDVLHLNDHHTALAAVYLRELYGDDPVLSRAGIVFSIHNLGYLGTFDSALLPKLGFESKRCSYGSAFEYRGGVSTLKLGIEYSDYVNTVSERYAEEIAGSPEFGHGLEGVLAEKRDAGRLTGILNGVDYSVWDPTVDELIPTRYSAADVSGKRRCRSELRARCGLRDDAEVPLIGMVSRLVDQKGFDLLSEVASDIIALGVQLVVLGTGQEEHHEFLKALESKHAGRVSANLLFDNKLAHWIEAGSDMFLMPSRYEPCGLNQMYSLRYGTVPIVRATGGLVDTVEDYDATVDAGVGFVFGEYNSTEMLRAIRRAVETYGDHDAWIRLMKRGMALDFSWGTSAGRYVELYAKAVATRGLKRRD